MEDVFLDLFRTHDFPETIDSYITQVGFGHITSSYINNGLERGMTQRCIWQYTVSGKGILDRQGQSIPVYPGSAMLLTLPDEHCYYLPLRSSSWDFYYLMFSGTESYKLFKKLQSKYGNIVKLYPDGPTLQSLHEIILLRKANQLHSPYKIAEYTARFLYRMCEELEDTIENATMPKFIQQIFRRAQQSPMIELKDMLQIAPYSKVYFQSIFKKHTNMTPHEYLLKLRFQRAVSLLEDTNLTIKEISEMCGFDDVAYFCRVFKKRLKYSPKVFRQLNFSKPE